MQVEDHLGREKGQPLPQRQHQEEARDADGG